MQFIRRDAAPGIQALSAKIARLLEEGKRILWLVPGGSNIPLSVQVMAILPEKTSERLTIMLTDERYGPIGHKDSNTKQLEDAGFNPKRASFIPALLNESLAATVRNYDKQAREQLAKHDAVIAQFGIGTDGHIAGILPHSPASAVQNELAAGYEAPDGFTRLTLTFPAFHSINTAFAFVYGKVKRTALQQLHDQDLLLENQPAQILKAIPEAYVYNDQVE